jgi:hypothetical protein
MKDIIAKEMEYNHLPFAFVLEPLLLTALKFSDLPDDNLIR